MTDGNEITDIFEGDFPALSPKHPREKRMCACYQRLTPLQLVLGRRRRRQCEPCTASAQNNRQSASRLLLLHFAEKGGGSGTKRGKKLRRKRQRDAWGGEERY